MTENFSNVAIQQQCTEILRYLVFSSLMYDYALTFPAEVARFWGTHMTWGTTLFYLKPLFRTPWHSSNRCGGTVDDNRPKQTAGLAAFAFALTILIRREHHRDTLAFQLKTIVCPLPNPHDSCAIGHFFMIGTDVRVHICRFVSVNADLNI
ncbi:hypothetical protein C8J57DRAFT_1304112 [Mycena rebaudengoi]|nr:hypothetical protein C8J57DRAFT_1304112 [Mycena rebaudengoi]